ncbi:MAG: ASCH domain-containing protein [Thaumarchaeota archaeon]|nr:ASCH domain-containing protein [Nitrososphaerota archaeon]
MKCLSVSQPFADLIVKGKKTIDLRSWNTNFRGEFLIHAPIKIRKEDYKRLKMHSKLPTGAIIGKAEIYDVKKYSSKYEIKKDAKKHFASKNFYNKKYGFCLRNAKEFQVPIPYKGKLGFFDVNLKPKIKKNQIKTDLIEEEYRYQWIGHH